MSKEPGVQKMFDAIAGRYDLMNRVMTLGQDQKWRRFVVRKAGDTSGGWVLDLATGTGDIGALMLDSNGD
ncbi:MAG: class I SAM-dependent methyltransferase, partial [Desulforhopalus sp.]